MIEAWQDRGIPLHIVIRSIESVFDVFDKQPVGTRSIKSLLYCREEIEVQYKEWSASQAGRPAENGSDSAFSTGDVADHITKTVAALRSNTSEALREDLERAIARLDELALDLTDDFETVDQTLGDIEKLLDRALLANWEPTDLKALQKEIAGHLRGYKADMEPEAYKSTFDLMLLKRLREEAGIPRFGLFYL
jgi:hypothetical protein